MVPQRLVDAHAAHQARDRRRIVRRAARCRCHHLSCNSRQIKLRLPLRSGLPIGDGRARSLDSSPGAGNGCLGACCLPSALHGPVVDSAPRSNNLHSSRLVSRRDFHGSQASLKALPPP